MRTYTTIAVMVIGYILTMFDMQAFEILVLVGLAFGLSELVILNNMISDYLILLFGEEEDDD